MKMALQKQTDRQIAEKSWEMPMMKNEEEQLSMHNHA